MRVREVIHFSPQEPLLSGPWGFFAGGAVPEEEDAARKTPDCPHGEAEGADGGTNAGGDVAGVIEEDLKQGFPDADACEADGERGEGIDDGHNAEHIQETAPWPAIRAAESAKGAGGAVEG